MRTFLRAAAVAILLGGLAFWAAKGANTGWTKNRVEKKSVDEVTGIEAITYEERFIPGVDFLGGVVVGAGALGGLSFLFGRRNKSESTI